MSNGRVCGDVLVIPSAQDGHVNPMMAIAVQLMLQGISVTVLLESNHELLDNFRSEEFESKGLLHVPVLTREEDEDGPEADAGRGDGRRGKGQGHSGGRRKDEKNEEDQEEPEADAGRGEGRRGRGRGHPGGRRKDESNEADQEELEADAGRGEGRRGRGRGHPGGRRKDEGNEEDQEELEADAGRGDGRRGRGRGHPGGRRKDERDEEDEEEPLADAGRGEGRRGRGRGHPGGRRKDEGNEEDQEELEADAGRGDGRRGRGQGHSGGRRKDERNEVDQEEPEVDAGKRGGGRDKGKRRGKSGIDTFLEKVLAEQEAGGQGPKCLMGDQVKGNLQAWADRLNIPRYVQMSSPATLAYFTYKYRSLLDDGIQEQLDNGEEDPIINLPGIPLLHLSDMPYRAKTKAESFAFNGDTYGEAGGLLFNTFYDLEASAIDAFHAQLKAGTPPGRQVPKLLPLGPLLPDKFFSEETFTGKSKDSECIEWLNSRPPSSVLYIAFGTRNRLNQDQAQELAYALEATKQSFLWVLRAPHAEGEGTDDFNELEEVLKLLPSGFQERTKDRGLIYPKFAPQLEILSNPATGGFLSHSGWNSCLESMSRGVPTISWPMGAEQSLCSRILVDQAKMTVEVKKGIVTNQHEVVDRGLLEDAIRRLMIDPAGKELKKKAEILQQQARAAMSPEGSSRKNMVTLVEDIKSWQPKSLQTQ